MNAINNQFQPKLEVLEDRYVPTITATGLTADGVLAIVGSAKADIVVVSENGNQINVASENGVVKSFDASKVKSIIITTGDSADVIVNATNRLAIIYAGNGDDFVAGGSGTDIIFGGTGNDYLFGQGGSDVLYGEDGNDTLVGGGGQDWLYGGYGVDAFYDATQQDIEPDRVGLVESNFWNDLSAKNGLTKWRNDLLKAKTPNYDALMGMISAADKFSALSQRLG
jgi:Ca2+-binding RTX toxin-like protein